MKIFILEDDPTRIGFLLESISKHSDGTESIHLATDADSAVRVFDPPYDLAFLDHDLGGLQMVESHEPNTGYQFLVRGVKAGDIHRAIVHSWNPAGAWAMYSLLTAGLCDHVSRQAFDPQTFEMLIPVLLRGVQMRDLRRAS